MIKDFLLRFVLIMMAIPVVLITHMSWDLFTSAEAGLQYSSIYHADTNSVTAAIVCMLVTWFVMLVVIREMLRSYRRRRAVERIMSKLDNCGGAGQRLQEQPSAADSWAKGDTRYMP